MTTNPTAPPLGPDSRVSGIVTETRTHMAKQHEWGLGAACTNRWVTGVAADVLVRDIDCKHCLNNEVPDSYQVRLPDRRYQSGYRVVSTGLTLEDAYQMVADLKAEKPAIDPDVVGVPITDIIAEQE